MDLCTQCGADLGAGRLCTNCGHPVSPLAAAESWRTDTADERRVLPWVAGLTVLALIGGFGLWLLLDSDQEPSRVVDPSAASTPPGEQGSDGSPDPAPEPTASNRPKPPTGAKPVDLASATPSTRPPPRLSAGTPAETR